MTQYRFPDWKGEEYNSRKRHEEKYESIEPYLGQHSIGAEIGVSAGGFGELLLPHCQLLFLVDPWCSPARQAVRDEEARFVADVYKNDSNVIIARERSDQFIPKLSDNSVDFFYLDGCHRYETVIMDLTTGYQKLKRGGYITGDDFSWETIQLALTHFSEATGVEHTRLQSDQWVVRKS